MAFEAWRAGCRALAAAVLGNPDFVQYVEVGTNTRFSALAENKADAVMYSSTWVLGREADDKVLFPAIYLFDRSYGPKAPVGVDRRINRLWSDGGLPYAPPFP